MLLRHCRCHGSCIAAWKEIAEKGWINVYFAEFRQLFDYICIETISFGSGGVLFRHLQQ
jgi:hypothetical protein